MSSARAQADRLELLAQTAEFMAEVRYGQRSFADRLAEMSDGGYPAGGQGSGSPAVSKPTEARLQWGDEKGPGFKYARRRPDPAADVQRRYDAALKRAHQAASELVRIHREHCEPHRGEAALSDPGCELCAELAPTGDYKVDEKRPTARTAVWYPTYGSTEIRDRKGKSRRVRLCYWDWRFLHKHGRIASREERLSHHEGRRVMVASR